MIRPLRFPGHRPLITPLSGRERASGLGRARWPHLCGNAAATPGAFAPLYEQNTNEDISMARQSNNDHSTASKAPQDDTPSNTVKDPDNWTTGGETMTGAQASYLKTLCE